VQSESPELSSVIEAVVRRMLRDYHAPMLAEVVSVQSDDQQRMRADIRPITQRLQYNEDTNEYDAYDYPVRRNAPVLIPSSAASNQTVKLAPGDLGLWVPLMHSLDGMVDTNIVGTVKPQDPRQQAFMDGFFLPTVFNQSVAGDADRYIEGGDVKLGTAASAEALAFRASVNSELNTFVINLNNALLAAFATVPYSWTPVTIGAVQGTSDVKAS